MTRMEQGLGCFRENLLTVKNNNYQNGVENEISESELDSAIVAVGSLFFRLLIALLLIGSPLALRRLRVLRLQRTLRAAARFAVHPFAREPV